MQHDDSTVPPSDERLPNQRQTPKAPIIAGAIGNAMEWYDFAIYAYFASVIAEVFFPRSAEGLLLTFATFGVGFFMRPLGGFVFGYYGDKLGRRAALTASISLMAVATFLIGVIPSHEMIGIWAPVLLLFFRLVQGFSVGGEYAGSASFLVEYANPTRRGLIGSIQSVSVFFGSLAGSMVGLLVTGLLSDDAVMSYGWRIPFLAGVLLGAVSLYLRLRVEDTPAFRALEQRQEVTRNPLADVLRTQYKAMAKVLALGVLFTVAYYMVLTYIPTYLSDELGFSLSYSLMVTSVAIVWGIVVIPFAGHLSDIVGRKFVLLTVAVGFVILSYPLFVVIGLGSKAAALVGVLALMSLVGVLYGIAPTTFVELFPTRVRYGGFSIPYNIATSIFGGFAPFIATLLIRITGNPLAPSYYLMFAALIAFVGLLTFEETAKAPLK